MSMHIVDDEQRRDRPQPSCGLTAFTRFRAATVRERKVPLLFPLLHSRGSVYAVPPPRHAALHLPPRRSERGPLYFHHGMLGAE